MTAIQRARRRSKYGSKRTTVGAITFSSKKEAMRYQELLVLQRAGIVTRIECQPKFIILDTFKKKGKKWPARHYIADFRVTYADGHQEIEDVKGRYMTEVFRLKWAFFEARYPDLELKIVTTVRGCR
jgi:hypothetical protein